MSENAMECEPQPLRHARLLVDRAATTGCAASELAEVRRRLQCLAAHPSCDEALGNRVAAAILILDLLGLASSSPAEALAS